MYPDGVRLGFISDTHGLLRPEAVRALEGCGAIVHAGDIGAPEILGELGRIAPVTAIRGNIDMAGWAARLPESVAVEFAGARVYVIHDVHDLALDPSKAGFDIVVSGHSHKPGWHNQGGVLYVNPGSAGRRRFRLPVTLATLELEQRPWQPVFVDLECGGTHRP